MQTVMLDGNVFDLLKSDDETRALVKNACEKKQIRIIISPVVMKELERSPFGGTPDFFPVEVIVESVAVAGLAIAGLAMPGNGAIFSTHLGTSNKGSDAVIADSASTYANVFVSEDSRCRIRLQQAHRSCICLAYREFQMWIAEVSKRRMG